MHEDRPRPRRGLCANCQYPTLRLDGFEGTSSRDAPVFGARGIDEGPDLSWGFVILPWLALKKLLRRKDKRNRVQEVARLKRDILPQAPEAMICPQCLRVAFPEDFA